MRINQNHPSYMPLHYTLLLPHSDSGWHWTLQLTLNDNSTQIQNQLEQRMYYQFHLHTQSNLSAILHRAERLFQQFLVDAFAVVDQNKLDWLRMHQNNICADVYNGLANSLTHADVDVTQLSYWIVLPSSYTGDNQYIQQRFQNSMAITRHLHKSALFIIFTANCHESNLSD